jgi:hypothetical protein
MIDSSHFLIVDAHDALSMSLVGTGEPVGIVASQPSPTRAEPVFFDPANRLPTLILRFFRDWLGFQPILGRVAEAALRLN